MLRLDWILAWVCSPNFYCKDQPCWMIVQKIDPYKEMAGTHALWSAMRVKDEDFAKPILAMFDAFILWNLPCSVQRLKSMGGNTDSGVRRCGQRIYACGQAVFLSVIGFEGRKSQWLGHCLIFDSISEHWIEKNLTFTKYWLSIQWAE